jgi:mycothiol system anti-sigma-R factor
MTHLITGFVDQELEGSQLGQVEHHLGKCSLCRERFEAERRLKALVQEHVQPVAAPADLRDRIRRRLDRESRRTPSLLDALRSNFSLHPGLSMAMAAALLLLVVLPSYFAFVRKPLAGDRVLAIAKSGQVVEITGEIIARSCFEPTPPTKRPSRVWRKNMKVAFIILDY